MKCSNPVCNHGIGVIAYQRSWFGKRCYCSKYCRDAFVVDASNLQQNLLKRFLVALVGLILPTTFTMAVLAAPLPSTVAPHLSGCDRNLADARASVAAMQARMKSLNSVDRSEICTATRIYFLEVVKARAMTALCKSGTERERDLIRFDAEVDHANEEIAARCL
jgi:hypothetical protein